MPETNYNSMAVFVLGLWGDGGFLAKGLGDPDEAGDVREDSSVLVADSTTSARRKAQATLHPIRLKIARSQCMTFATGQMATTVRMWGCLDQERPTLSAQPHDRRRAAATGTDARPCLEGQGWT
jgi:hypothetical protein